MTNISWADKSLNFVIGCTECSEACSLCYARTMHNRNVGNPKHADYTHNFNVVTELPNRLDKYEVEKLSRWRKSRKIFVNSMSDTFHSDVSNDFIIKMFELFNRYPKHVYQILTKRPVRMLKMDQAKMLPMHDNIWFGTTVELAKYYHRIDQLRKTGATVKWLSLEPLLGPMDDIDLKGIDLVIVGGESNQPKMDRPNHRPPIKMEYEWIDKILDKCREYGVAFFYKQSGVLQPCLEDHEDGTPKCKGNKGCEYFRGKRYTEFPGDVCPHPIKEINCTDCTDKAMDCNCIHSMAAVCGVCGFWFDDGSQGVVDRYMGKLGEHIGTNPMWIKEL